LHTIDPAKFYSISKLKLEIAKQVIRAKGRKIKVEEHGGARQRRDRAVEKARKKYHHRRCVVAVGVHRIQQRAILDDGWCGNALLQVGRV